MSKIDYINNYINRLKMLLDSIDSKVIEQIINTVEHIANSGNRLYLIGNGGSAATASHIANDLGSGLRRRDIINLDVISLCDNLSVISALANDIGYDNIFYMQLKDIIKPHDTLLAISCSGNSPNIIKACQYAKQKGAKVIGVSGFDGGKLKDLSDINFFVASNKGEYGLVEDVHMILDHIIYSYFIEEYKSDE